MEMTDFEDVLAFEGIVDINRKSNALSGLSVDNEWFMI